MTSTLVFSAEGRKEKQALHCVCSGETEKKNIEHRTSNIEYWMNKMSKQKNYSINLDANTLRISVISVGAAFQPRLNDTALVRPHFVAGKPLPQ